MDLIYHCITTPRTSKIQVTRAGGKPSLQAGAKVYRTRDREAAHTWMMKRLNLKTMGGSCDDLDASFEAESVLQAAELSLAQALWEQATPEQREAWCQEVGVEAPRSAKGLKEVPSLWEEIIDPVE
jgi:hypothetical protein